MIDLTKQLGKRTASWCLPANHRAFRVTGPGALAVFALTAIALTAWTTGACAQTQLWSAPGIENVVCVTAAPDIDGDGGPDVIFESYDAGAPQQDNLYAIRGASSGAGEVIWSARPLGGPSNSGGYGDACLRMGPDTGGDGFPDVMIGMAWGNRSAFSLDGRTGATQWKFDTYSDSPPAPPVSGWVYAMASLEQDIDDDGVSGRSSSAWAAQHAIYCVSERTAARPLALRGRGRDVRRHVDRRSRRRRSGRRHRRGRRQRPAGHRAQRRRRSRRTRSGIVIWLRDAGLGRRPSAGFPISTTTDCPRSWLAPWARRSCAASAGINGADLWTGIVERGDARGHAR
ncbi:MAG: hypothetical protein R3E12_04260 [Candidatus Eisenbacteria bacterium]